MNLGTRCLSDRALDGEAVCAALAAVGLDGAVLTAQAGTSPRELAQAPVRAVRCTWEDGRLGIAAAAAAGAGLLAVELPADDELDLETACRGLFDLHRAQPGLAVAVQTPAGGPLADPESLGHVLDDLASRNTGWWHVPSRVRLADGDDLPWFERLGGRLVGLSLDDVAGGQGGLPPGLGELDLPRLAELTGRGVAATLDPDPVPDPALLRSAVETLRAAGFP